MAGFSRGHKLKLVLKTFWVQSRERHQPAPEALPVKAAPENSGYGDLYRVKMASVACLET